MLNKNVTNFLNFLRSMELIRQSYLNRYNQTSNEHLLAFTVTLYHSSNLLDFSRLSLFTVSSPFSIHCPHHVLIDQAQDPYEEIFVLTFKAHGLERRNEYLLFGPSSRLVRAFYCILTRINQYEMEL